MHRKLYVAGSSCYAAPGCCVCVLSGVQSVTPRTASHQAPLSLGFSGPQYWNGLPFFLQGIFLTQGWNPHLLYCRWILYLRSHRGSPHLQPQLSQTRMPCDLLPATLSPVAGADWFNQCLLKRCCGSHLVSGAGTQTKTIFIPTFRELTNKGTHSEDCQLSILSLLLPGRPWKFQNLRAQNSSSVAQLCPTFCNPMDCSIPGFPVHTQASV